MPKNKRKKKWIIRIIIISVIIIFLIILLIYNTISEQKPEEKTPENSQPEEKTPENSQSPTSWSPPIGIPAPSFGIEETVDMYIGQQYTFNDGRGKIDYPISPVSGKPYTHYVDNTHPNCYSGCTYYNMNPQRNYDCGDVYGSPSQPLCHIPTHSLSEGSIVEVNGGAYSFGIISGDMPKYHSWVYADGTKTKPIFIRGGEPKKVELYLQELNLAGGSYLIIENIEFYGGKITISNMNHASLRNLEIHNTVTLGGGSAVYVGGTKAKDIVIYNNLIYNNWGNDGTKEKDYHGIVSADNTERIWIEQNEIYGHSGDSIQVNACSFKTCKLIGKSSAIPRYIYIGRNKLHNDCENAIDLKDSEHVIVSQNRIYGYSPCGGSDGTAIPGGNEGTELSWFLFNDIYDSVQGIRIDDEFIVSTAYIIGNTIHDLHTAKNINGVTYGGNGIVTWRHMNVFVYNNVFYNVESGFKSAFAAGTDSSNYEIINNIFSNVNAEYISMQGTVSADNTIISNNLFFNSKSINSIRWGGSSYYKDIASFMASEGKCSGCLESNPLFVSSSNFNLQTGSPAIDNGIESKVYTKFQNLYGIDIKKDIEGKTRPQGAGWDIGAYEKND